MFRPEMVKEHWTTLKPKVREFWPNLTEQDVQATARTWGQLIIAGFAHPADNIGSLPALEN